MPFKLNFLSSASPLTKTISRLPTGAIVKSGYPNAFRFTSETLEISTLQEFHAVLAKRVFDENKPCLLKGQIKEPLVNQSRKESTSTNDRTQWVCLDMDQAKFSSPEEVMHAIGLSDISYLVQYSSSHKIDTKTLNCHIFFMLDKPRPAPQLKTWLMHLNFTTPALESTITLSKHEQALHYPLDITACQNDKLLYVAAPTFVGMKDPVPPADRVKLVMKSKSMLDTITMKDSHLDALRTLARTKLNQLRVAKGLKPQTAKLKQVGEYEVQPGAGPIANYEVIDCGEYVRFNLNGGDSQAYWHKKGDLEYLHNFKGEPSLILKEVLPDYYAEQVRDIRTGNLTPSTSGDLVLCFQDRVTGEYWWGTWNPDKNHLDLNTVGNETKLSNAVRSYGIPVPDPVPIWTRLFDPKSNVRVDEDKRIVNIFEPTKYMTGQFKKGPFPIIQRLLNSAVGVGTVQDHFINWLAVMWQYRVKPMTAWVLHGNQGTGKGLIWAKVIRPLFGEKNTAYKLAHELNEQYNGWMESSLVAVVDEVEADMFNNARMVEAKMKAYITDLTTPIRRMRTDTYEVLSYIGWLFYSNKPKPVHIPPSDRRFNIGQFQHKRFITSGEEVNKIEGELEAFAAYLSTYKADRNRAAQVLQTIDREEIQKVSISSTDEIGNAILSADLEYFWEYVSPGQGSSILDPIQADYNAVIYRITREVIGKSIMRLSREDMWAIFRLSNKDTPQGNKFTSMLRHKGIHLKRMRAGNDVTYGIEVRVRLLPELRRMLIENLACTNQHLKGVAK